jgi:uncharacterized protein (DUF952 family)
MIYHVTTQKEWNDCLGKAGYAPANFSREGFIHTCLNAQLTGVLDRYFKGQSNLLLLHIQEEKLKVPLKYEPSTLDELFPHIYGPINKEAIIKVEKLNLPWL